MVSFKHHDLLMRRHSLMFSRFWWILSDDKSNFLKNVTEKKGKLFIIESIQNLLKSERKTQSSLMKYLKFKCFSYAHQKSSL